MTSKQANKYSLISFITGVLVVFFLFVLANIFPHFQLNALGRNIIVGVIMLPWLSFLFFMILSMRRNN